MRTILLVCGVVFWAANFAWGEGCIHLVGPTGFVVGCEKADEVVSQVSFDLAVKIGAQYPQIRGERLQHVLTCVFESAVKYGGGERVPIEYEVVSNTDRSLSIRVWNQQRDLPDKIEGYPFMSGQDERLSSSPSLREIVSELERSSHHLYVGDRRASIRWLTVAAGQKTMTEITVPPFVAPW